MIITAPQMKVQAKNGVYEISFNGPGFRAWMWTEKELREAIGYMQSAIADQQQAFYMPGGFELIDNQMSVESMTRIFLNLRETINAQTMTFVDIYRILKPVREEGEDLKSCLTRLVNGTVEGKGNK